jgi:excinuclease ABC subunit C
MEEVLTRRFKRWQSGQEAAAQPGAKADASFSVLPDLLIVDGGKGQLGRAAAVLERAGLAGRLAVVGLAKQEEEIFFPGKRRPLSLPPHSQGLYLIQRIRDEAHRFAITAHRARRSKQGMASILDSVPGIGPAKRKTLLMQFGSVDKIREASLEDLMQVKGISRALAEGLKAHLE